MFRIALAGIVCGCGLLVWAEEPAAPSAPAKAEGVAPAAGAAPPAVGDPSRKARFIERLKQKRAEGDPAKKTADGPGGAAGALDRFKQLKGKMGGPPLDMTKFKRSTWKVADVEREALVYLPPAATSQEKASAKRPVVFVFHGHGGTAEFAAKRMAFYELWPEAISVYPQGLPTAAPVIDVDGKHPGWQKHVGDQEDRDLAFFDAMLKSLRAEHSIDDNRIYACGHSNGGFFCYVLLPARGAQLAAIAPIAGALNPRDAKDVQPLPIFHVAGERDPLVKYDSQMRGIEHMRKVNGCDAEGKPAGENCTAYTSKNGPPVMAYLHPGAHEVPRAALPMIVEFFQQNVRNAAPAAAQRAAAP